ncbi:MAG: response regulator transcription factor [Planctomycetes bacterium]|nr:response regulator transcription factor [Planctomycetota bacterium]
MIQEKKGPLRATIEAPLVPRRVYLLDDSRVTRAALRRVIHEAGGFDVVGESDEVAFALKDAPHRAPDVIVFDPFLDGNEGVHGLMRLGLRLPRSSIVVATADEERAVSELRIGGSIRALVSKDGDPAEFVRALRAAGDGAWFMCPRLVGRQRGRCCVL